MEYIQYEPKGAYAIITISREKAMNALNSQVLEELNAALDGVDLQQIRNLYGNRMIVWLFAVHGITLLCIFSGKREIFCKKAGGFEPEIQD